MDDEDDDGDDADFDDGDDDGDGGNDDGEGFCRRRRGRPPLPRPDALSCPKLTRPVAAPSARASPVRWSGRGGEGLAATSARGTMDKRRKILIDAVAADCTLNPVRFAYPHQPIRKQLRSVREHWEGEGNGEQGGLEEMAIRPKEICRIMRKPRP